MTGTGGGPPIEIKYDYLDQQLNLLEQLLEANNEEVVLPPAETWEKKVLTSLMPNPNTPSTSGSKNKKKPVEVKYKN